ncbi:MAG TPA: M1 family metallopeptidase [Thermoanaerobaculia bacterium]|nr:M1 family metallopeptidase [Thermoanaerobaculia bacterium]
MTRLRSCAPLLLLLLAACGTPAPAPPVPAASPAAAPQETAAAAVDDPHSHANSETVRVRHLELDLAVDFAARRLSGRAGLLLDNPADARRLVLDTRDLEVRQVRVDGGDAAYELGEPAPHLGRPLIVELPPAARRVEVDYVTSPDAAALQWLTANQTAVGRHPFLFTQSQAILARTWIPLQDTPAVRFTYEATLRVPPGLMAVMSADNPQRKAADGVYRFSMPQAIPSYLMALAVGDLEFRATGDRSGVYAEPPVVEAAAWEFAQVPEMMATVEELYGPYRWGRYDLLVLPPSFPFGGMENPRLTFVTPTILAGDRSLVSLVAHELAHSWSGNLVTNATWNDFWLNEGFTTYLENRIMEALFGRPYAEMLAQLGRQDLEEEIAQLGADSPDTRLHLDLGGRDPDEGMTAVAYDKGALLLRLLENEVGRERFDAFLRAYFDRHAFQSMTTAAFLAYLERELLARVPQLDADALRIDAWVHGVGLPANAPRVEAAELERVEGQLERLAAGAPAGELDTGGWTTHHWLHLLRHLPAELPQQRLAELDRQFGLSDSGNSEVLFAWLMQAVRQDYEPAYPALERFLTGMGRRKFLEPLYRELAKDPEGRRLALRIYARARPGYHSVAVHTVDAILDWGATAPDAAGEAHPSSTSTTTFPSTPPAASAA